MVLGDLADSQNGMDSFFPHPLFTVFAPFNMTSGHLLSSTLCGKYELTLPKGTVMSLSVD